ncbi:hypothetical protein EDC01DRAFT_294267 [Geopyxis carbonaria]|nr:hypothetical protein EDC01DRAFT_294267 [Geopyxis carbonaria]
MEAAVCCWEQSVGGSSGLWWRQRSQFLVDDAAGPGAMMLAFFYYAGWGLLCGVEQLAQQQRSQYVFVDKPRLQCHSAGRHLPAAGRHLSATLPHTCVWENAQPGRCWYWKLMHLGCWYRILFLWVMGYTMAGSGDGGEARKEKAMSFGVECVVHSIADRRARRTRGSWDSPDGEGYGYL